MSEYGIAHQAVCDNEDCYWARGRIVPFTGTGEAVDVMLAAEEHADTGHRVTISSERIQLD